MPTLRVEYLAALGLEPLVLRAGQGESAGRGSVDALDARAGDAVFDVGRVSDGANAVATPASAAAKSSTAADAAQATRRAEASGAASRTRREAPSDDAGLFAPQPARLCFILSDGSALSGPHERLLRALAVAVGVSPAQLGFEARDDLPLIVFATDIAAAANTSSTAIHAPTPAGLRSAKAKRALWPALRRLRRTLRNTP